MSRREQVLVGFRCDPELREQLELALRGMPMSQFLREAVIEKLATIVGPLDPRLAKAPSRLGKGGPKPRRPAPAPPSLDEQHKDLRRSKVHRPGKNRTEE